MSRELLEVERLARQLAKLVGKDFSVDCGALCEGENECNAVVKGTVDCPKCGEVVPFREQCRAVVTCDYECLGCFEFSADGEVAHVLRELELALVRLDCARLAPAGTT